MKNLVFFVFILCLVISSVARGSDLIQQRINSDIHRYGHGVDIGVLVKTLTTDQTLYAYNASRAFVPASNIKLLTAAAALRYLGSDYHFTTSLFANKDALGKGVVSGDVYLQFGGDPELTTNQLVSLFAALKARNIKTIRGNLIIEDSRLGQVKSGPGWMWDEINRCYAAPIGAIILNHNCFQFRVSPTYTGRHPRLTFPGGLVPIINDAQTASYNCGPLQLNFNGANRYTLQGCIHRGAKPVTMTAAVRDPQGYAVVWVQTALRQLGIKLTGHVEFGDVPSSATVIATHQSRPLVLIVHDMIKKSDDVVADALFKTLAYTYYQKPGTWDRAVIALESILSQQYHLSFDSVNIVDGAGISRYNLVTPDFLVELLERTYRDKTISRQLLDSLPVGGINGTLAYRFTHMRNHVFAKTGTMTGVSTLSGYLRTRRGHWLVFSIMTNGFVGSPRIYQGLEDRIVYSLYESY